MKEFQLKKVLREIDKTNPATNDENKIATLAFLVQDNLNLFNLLNWLNQINDSRQRTNAAQKYYRHLVHEISVRYLRYAELTRRNAHTSYDYLLQAIYDLHNYSETVLYVIPPFNPEKEPVSALKAFEFYCTLHDATQPCRTNLESMFGDKFVNDLYSPIKKLHNIFTTTREYLNHCQLLAGYIVSLSKHISPPIPITHLPAA